MMYKINGKFFQEIRNVFLFSFAFENAAAACLYLNLTSAFLS